MDVVTLLGGLVLVVIAAFFVVQPLVRPVSYGDLWLEAEEEDETKDAQRHMIFSTLAEIELDYRTGKLSEEDYRLLSNHYKRQAVAILKAEEGAEEALLDLSPEEQKAIEAEIEAELARLRGQGKGE